MAGRTKGTSRRIMWVRIQHTLTHTHTHRRQEAVKALAAAQEAEKHAGESEVYLLYWSYWLYLLYYYRNTILRPRRAQPSKQKRRR